MDRSNLVSYGIIMIIVAAGGYYFLVHKKQGQDKAVQRAAVVRSYQELSNISEKGKIILEGKLSNNNPTNAYGMVIGSRENLKRGRERAVSREDTIKASWGVANRFAPSFNVDLSDGKTVTVRSTGELRKANPSGDYHTEYSNTRRTSRYKGMKKGDTISVLANVVPVSSGVQIYGIDYYGGTGDEMASATSRNKLLLTIGAIVLAIAGVGVSIYGKFSGGGEGQA